MARFLCKCGETLSNSLSPNEIQYKVFSDQEWDDIINMGEVDSIDLPDSKFDVWKCPKCGRLHIFDENNNLQHTYILEE